MMFLSSKPICQIPDVKRFLELSSRRLATSGQWTHIKKVHLMGNTRLLHSELCNSLKMFNLGYGPLILGLFTTSYINFIVGVYFIVNSKVFTSFHSTKNNWVRLLPPIVHVQIVMFLMSIIVFASFINEKVIQNIIQPAHIVIVDHTFVHTLVTIFYSK